MTTAKIFDLEAHHEVDLTTVLTGPLRAARLVTLAPSKVKPSSPKTANIPCLSSKGPAPRGQLWPKHSLPRGQRSPCPWAARSLSAPEHNRCGTSMPA
jgi:hypothetical protein